MKQKVVNRGELAKTINSQKSILICSTSFESRWKSVIEDVGLENWSQVLLFNNSARNDNTGTLYEEGDNLTYAPSNYNDPVDVLMTCNRLMLPALKKQIQRGNQIIFDISTFTREMLLIILKVLDYFEFLKHTSFVYTPSKSMNKNWLSKGVLNTRSVLGYAGDFDLNNETHLVVLSGFEIERSIEAIEEYEPTHLTVLSGNKLSSYSGAYYERSKELVDTLKTHYGSSVSSEEIDITDLGKLKSYFLEFLSSDRFRDQNIVIAPLSNKISTLALGLAILEFKRPQVIYPQPAEYNMNGYSEASDEYYLFINE